MASNIADLPEENPSSLNTSVNISSIVYCPIINGLQKMALYTTRTRCYLIGSNNKQTKFRVLKIDRTEPHKLVLTDDKVEYTQSEIKDLLLMIGGGNKISNRSASKTSTAAIRTISAFGIFGFIRFLEGYYIILITKRRKVAVIGHHSIYKVEDTSMIYIPHESVRKTHEDEHKYVKLWNNIDLTSNFYFSYSYDLTNSLQFNLSPPVKLEESVQDAKESFMNSSSSDVSGYMKNENVRYIGIRTFPAKKFIWNKYLLEPLKEVVHPSWILPITQGFIAQNNIPVVGRSFFVTLIARRAASYAGTRFLKRGANFEGDVANEVETEQIVHDAHISSFQCGRFASFVQIRGSIPCHWSQDISKMVPKPPINIDVWDPYAQTAGEHFNKLLRRFGAPIVVLNLVKRREKKRHESILNEEYIRLIQQLNLTIHPSYRIQHVSVDMARINKDKKENVMSRLADFAYQSIKKTGIFLTQPPYYIHHLNPDPHYKQLERTSTHGDSNFGTKGAEILSSRGRLQTGVVRVNCVDCLDRTNTAQFALGKCALAFQLYCLGVLEKPSLEFDTDCVRMLEEMYEDHGDTLALQYGGSQLVHRIATYRKTAPWTSHGNDIRQSLTRYFSNTFSDQEKQQAMNLFLGIFVPLKQSIPIWELMSDYILHQSLAKNIWPCHRKSTSQWWDSEVMSCLPMPCDLAHKKAAFSVELHPKDPRIDLFQDFYRPFELCGLSDFFSFHMNQCTRYGDSYQTVELDSPFSVRFPPGAKKLPSTSPSRRLSLKAAFVDKTSSLVSPGSAAASNASSGASSTETEPTEEELTSLNGFETESDNVSSERGTSLPLDFNTFFPSYEGTYGNIILPIPERDLHLYHRHATIGSFISKTDGQDLMSSRIRGSLFFEPLDNSIGADAYEIAIPVVPEASVVIYQNYVESGLKGPVPPKRDDLVKYQMYISGA